MKPYKLYHYFNHHPLGGENDCIGSFWTISGVIAASKRQNDKTGFRDYDPDSYQLYVVNTYTGVKTNLK